MAGVVIGEVVGAVAIADDEELEEAEEGLGVAVAGIVFIIHDLLHGPAWVDAQGFQLDLHAWHAVDEDDACNGFQHRCMVAGESWTQSSGGFAGGSAKNIVLTFSHRVALLIDPSQRVVAIGSPHLASFKLGRKTP